ncbi:unnamed protein product [Cylicocyclus nassatus]|uniref:RING-type domain-containing protein n=1 Tax=Cylicocyclus nassatus TaxID=53992 RepID=A0AA36M3F0_CYLNA|nr:unnamed protein product [Cylicocyclus nassatus]
MSSIYYCHQCRNQVPLRNTDMICGICGGEFLEQLSTPPPRPQPRFVHHPAGRVHYHQHLHHHPPTQHAHIHLQQGPSQATPENFLSTIMGMINNMQGPAPTSSTQNGTEAENNAASENPRPQGPQSVTFSLDQAMQMHPILSQVLATLGNPNMQVRIHIGDDADGTMHGAFGDYVWGDSGMDRIVTQLLNQMDGNMRPVGLNEQQINRIPIIKVTQEHVDKGTQCTTCFEDFKLGELVAELQCHHIFHCPCVVPWLQQRPSCPICRQEVIASQFPDPAPGAPTVSSLEAKHDLIEPELD